MLLELGSRAFRLIAIVGLTAVALRFLSLIIDNLIMPKPGSKMFYLEEKRAKTLTVLLKSIIRYTVFFIAGLSILHEFQIDTTSILAGAGIVGLAVGVGAQGLVKDTITGFFIILEDQYSVGDYIECIDQAGTVEEIGFRVTKLRDFTGVLHIIPNGSISRVSNHTRGSILAVVRVPVSYEADLDKVLHLLDQVCDTVGSEFVEVLDGPRVLGVVDLQEGNLFVNIVAKTVPLEQWRVERALRYKIKQLFDEAGIPGFGLSMMSKGLQLDQRR
jgi:small conductance mechanosensitive channel